MHSRPVLLVATTNPGKLGEIRRALQGLSIDLLTLADLPPMPEPVETGATFAENAWLKARTYADASKLPTVAEDSGLVIDALGGRPGVESARYPGETYADKFAGLYRELRGVPPPWTARFVCSLALIDHANVLGHGQEFSTEGIVEGRITDTPRGAHGFGYDPIFFYPPFGCTLAEASPERKLAVSHRGKAFGRLSAFLRGSVA